MDIRKIKKLIELIETSGVAEIEISEGEESIRIVKTPAPRQEAAPAVSLPPPSASVTPPTESVSPAPPDAEENVFRSPMVGTFYRSPGPDQPPFVKEGDAIKKGDILCIIEAMKIMNQVTAIENGIIRKILVSDGESVEFNQPLFLIE